MDFGGCSNFQLLVALEGKFGMKHAFALAGELGFTIAVPIVGFAFLGRFLDRTLGTSPWLILGSIFVSLPIVMILVYRKVRKLT